MPFRPIKLTKIEFDWNYFIFVQRDCARAINLKERIKVRKLHVSFSFFLKQITKSNLNNNFKKLHAVST